MECVTYYNWPYNWWFWLELSTWSNRTSRRLKRRWRVITSASQSTFVRCHRGQQILKFENSSPMALSLMLPFLMTPVSYAQGVLFGLLISLYKKNKIFSTFLSRHFFWISVPTAIVAIFRSAKTWATISVGATIAVGEKIAVGTEIPLYY